MIFERTKRKRVGQPPKYHHLFYHLKNLAIYNPPAIVTSADQSGLFPDEPDKEQLKESATATIRSYLYRSLTDPPDGMCAGPGNRPGWYGWRLKALVYREEPLTLSTSVWWVMIKMAQIYCLFQRRREIRGGLLLILTLLGFLIGLGYVQTKTPAGIVSRLVATPSLGTIKQLRRLLLEPEFESQQAFIIRSIARTQTKLDLPIPIIEDFNQISAVLAVDQPSVLFTSGLSLMRGDRVTLSRIHGHVYEITKYHLVLETHMGFVSYRFPPLYLFGNVHYRPTEITIYPNANNMRQILNHVCERMEVRLVGKLDGPSNMVGFWTMTRIEDFLADIDAQIGAKYDPQKRILEIQKGHALRSIIGFTPFFARVRAVPLATILTEYERYLGYHIQLSPSKTVDSDLMLVQGPVQIQELAEALKLSLIADHKTHTIHLSGG